MAKRFNQLPSKILNIEDEYTAYCFDEVCVYILTKIENGQLPHFVEDETENKGLQLLVD